MNSSYSSYGPGAFNPILHIILVQFILFFKSSWCKMASAERNWIKSASQAAATAIAFSSVLYRYLFYGSRHPSIFSFFLVKQNKFEDIKNKFSTN